ncbi:acyl-CoA dehydrogenase family protein [Streptomyces gilvus]|uniref:acyl-CoA dehydrogenase family protein n=1 Tax=Streptomyces gilvus TaxID=2920937 RepID=UPI001F0FA36F|nr:acyl-CoA dehydrogenase family protein [Streptomyces sp. CME 23]MCH5675635.1 acyl-CoA/acyl-ACP dehydrogenase [Streptomyces sp. CME 23]
MLHTSTNLTSAQSIVDVLQAVIEKSAAHIASWATDEDQTVAYDLASMSSAVAAAAELLRHGTGEEAEADLALVYAADVAADLSGRLTGREALWGVAPTELAGIADQVAAGRDPALLDRVAERVLASSEAGPRHLSEDLQLVRSTFRKFAEDRILPVAERIHREDEDIPAEIIEGLAEMGCFGLSIPAEYGGSAEGGADELLSMVVVTEELSQASLGAAGSLITRPEIIGTAIARGGTEEQKQRWLPGIAAGEKLCGVAVTEPDYGSDVAGVTTRAVRDGDDWVLTGVKTWCTFAGRANYLLVLARTNEDRTVGHRGLSLFVVEKPSFPGHEWSMAQEGGGTIEGRAIRTLGYRGMHSYEVRFDRWRVPATDLIGMDDGLGRGFYLQMQAFANARLQTAARAVGVMQSALGLAVDYTRERSVFGRPLAGYQLTRVKIARMAALVAACRAFAFSAARAVTANGGQLEASQVKQLACRAAEWVTREAQQLHGGYGYAEEYTVSRLFVDARVLSIFEGADEVLALRVIARQLTKA